MFVTASVTNGLTVSVAIAGTEAEVGGLPASEVGVAYWPHNAFVPPQAVSRKEIAINKLIMRFKVDPLIGMIIPVEEFGARRACPAGSLAIQRTSSRNLILSFVPALQGFNRS